MEKIGKILVVVGTGGAVATLFAALGLMLITTTDKADQATFVGIPSQWVAYAIAFFIAVAFTGIVLNIFAFSAKMLRCPRGSKTVVKCFAAFVLAAPFLTSCAGGLRGNLPTEPREIYVPSGNTDPREGLVRSFGTALANVWIYDQAGQLVGGQVYYLPGARQPFELEVNRSRQPVILKLALPPGTYRIEYLGWYRELVGMFPPRFALVELNKGSGYFSVGSEPKRDYDSYTRRYWGWVLDINGGDIPSTDAVRFNIRFRCC